MIIPATHRGFIFCLVSSLMTVLWICPVSAGEDESLVIIYTGQTQSFLDVCGCATGQMGGLARRAAVIDDLRRQHPNSLLLDAGGLFAGSDDVDRLRSTVHLDAMERMGYDAANVGVGELRFGGDYLRAAVDSSGFALFSTNLVLPGDPDALPTPRVLSVGDRRIALVGLTEVRRKLERSDPSEAGPNQMGEFDDSPDLTDAVVTDPLDALSRVLAEAADVEVVIVLADLEDSITAEVARQLGDRGVVIAVGEDAGLTRSERGYILGTGVQGKRVGVAVLALGRNGVTAVHAEAVPLLPGLAEDKEIAALVTGFYEEIANRPDLQAAGKSRLVRFGEEQRALEGRNGYVSADACRPCHLAEYADWASTPHAGAFRRLQQVQKHMQPDCVACHSVGSGLDTGYRIGKETPQLEGVQCETCHGPGALHARRPEIGNIRGALDAEVCQSCHTAEQTPEFEAHVAEMFARVNHTSPTFNPHMQSSPEALSHAADGKPTVELFVMAHCPYGMEAEDALAPMLKRLGDGIEFKLHFIADEAIDDDVRAVSRPVRRADASNPRCESEESFGSGPFKSLHGDPEIEEGIRQVTIASAYPDRFLDYVLCRNQEEHVGDWQGCAQQAGIDVSRIVNAIALGEGERLFRENIRRARALGINASPTLRVNGVEMDLYLEPDRLARHICESTLDGFSGVRTAACDSVPACGADVDCTLPGKVGICVSPGAPEARCQYGDPVAFDMTVINDPECGICETGYFVRSTLALFPGARVRAVSSSEEVAKAILDRYGLDRLPTFLLSEAFGQTARFERYARSIVPVEGGYLPDPTMFLTSSMQARPKEAGRIDLFLQDGSLQDLALVRHISGWAAQQHIVDRLHVHMLGLQEGRTDGNTLLALHLIQPETVAAYADCRLRDQKECLSFAGADEVEVAAWIERYAPEVREASRALSDSLRLPTGFRPAVLLENQILIHPRVVGRVPELYDYLLQGTGK